MFQEGGDGQWCEHAIVDKKDEKSFFIFEALGLVTMWKCWEDGMTGQGMETPCQPLPHASLPIHWNWLLYLL